MKLALCGLACSGKTTIANLLHNKYGFEIVGFSDPIYDVATDIFMMRKKDRKLLQDIGQSLRSVDSEVFIKNLLYRINKYPCHDYVVDDVRLAKEAKALQENGFFICYVDASEGNRQDRSFNKGLEWRPDHQTEQEMRIAPDYLNYFLSNNDTLEDLNYETLRLYYVLKGWDKCGCK